MRRIIQRTILAFCCIYFHSLSYGQNLSPAELFSIHQNPDFTAITTFLAEKGFTKSNEPGTQTAATTVKWYFRPFTSPGEDASFYVAKSVDSARKAKTKLTIFNTFHYKEFIAKLVKENYKFKGIKIVNSTTYSVFKSRKKIILTTQHDTGKHKTCFEILLDTVS